MTEAKSHRLGSAVPKVLGCGFGHRPGARFQDWRRDAALTRRRDACATREKIRVNTHPVPSMPIKVHPAVMKDHPGVIKSSSSGINLIQGDSSGCAGTITSQYQAKKPLNHWTISQKMAKKNRKFLCKIKPTKTINPHSEIPIRYGGPGASRSETLTIT